MVFGFTKNNKFVPTGQPDLSQFKDSNREKSINPEGMKFKAKVLVNQNGEQKFTEITVDNASDEGDALRQIRGKVGKGVTIENFRRA